ncbi:MAG: hypothetical protein AAGE96_06840 [Cyanobacteria bacterium P01_G01_bin.19]
MANLTTISQGGKEQDKEIWVSLRQAISKSSGFQSWQQERGLNAQISLDLQVRRYLEETLETLAY